jgi:tRNA pseudouridine55 synthase
VTTSGSGLLVVDKPAGMTSHDVVSRVRRLARTRKVGHAGTLDPMATGVLLLGVEKATRLLGHLSLTDKAYEATVRLGVDTTTDDAEGEVVSTRSATGLSEADVRAAVRCLVGELDQVPSSVSAVKVGGRRAHARVRAGEEVVLAPRRVRVAAFEVHRVQRHDDVLDLEVSVRCSSGTYVRALARDLGEQLGVGGYLTALRRTAVGAVELAQATPLGVLEERGEVELLPMEAAAARFFPLVSVDAEAARAVCHGQRLALDLDTDDPVAVLGPDGAFLALYRRTGPGAAKPIAVFA